MRNINNILRKNRRILAELRGQGTFQIAKSLLQEKGYNFEYFTQTKNERCGTAKFCYEYGLIEKTDRSECRIVDYNFAKSQG